MSIKFSPIIKNQYEVEINFNEFDDCYRCGFEKQIKEIYHYENEYAFISTLEKGILKYKSESILPEVINSNKPKLLFIFGNPANHSIAHGMFFFSNQKGGRHNLWNKLNKANIIQQIKSSKNIPIDARNEESKTRKDIILKGNEPNSYLIGLTTFYSFPTSADGGVEKVEEIFSPIIETINQAEVKRINDYAFTKNAKLIFVQQSSYKAFLSIAPEKESDTVFWPIRGKGSSGDKLLEKLKQINW